MAKVIIFIKLSTAACIFLSDEKPGGEETVGALPQETDRREPSCFPPSEGERIIIIDVCLKVSQLKYK